MILRSLELKHFGKFGERTFDFRRGMNLVLGPNEAGKSTIMEAIPAVLFGVRDKDRFKPWGRQGSSEAALVLEGRSGTIILRASLFFGQGQIEISGNGGLSGKIKSLLSGFVEVDYDKVLSSLSDDLFVITRSNPWGKDKTKERELEQVTQRITALGEEWYQGRKTIEKLEGVRNEISELGASIEIDRGEYTKGEKYLAWVRKQWQLEEKEDVLRKDFNRVSKETAKVEDLEKQREDLEKVLGKTGLPVEMPEDLPLILAEAEDVRKELVALQGESALLREELLAHMNPPWRLSALLSLLICAGGGALAWYRQEWMVQSLLGAGLVTAIYWVFYLYKAGKERAERGRVKGQAQVLERKREEAQARLAGLDERFEAIGMSPSAVEIVKMQKNLERHREITGQLKEVASALKVLEKAEELKRDQSNLTRELAVLDERMEKERPLRPQGLLSREELPDAEEKLQELGESLQDREKRLLELTRQEAALQAGLADLQQIEEEGEELKKRESALVRRRDALIAAYELLSESVEEFRQTYLDRFSSEIASHFSAATCGRYGAVRLDETFSIALQTREGQWQEVESFSRGTVDALYFAVRLALTRHLSRGRNLPLLLDDPLVNFDAVRLGETLAALEGLSTDHQVILFAHNDGLLKRAGRKSWNVLSLDEKKPVKQSVAAERKDDVGQLHLL